MFCWKRQEPLSVFKVVSVGLSAKGSDMDMLKYSRCVLLAAPGTVVSISSGQCWPLDERLTWKSWSLRAVFCWFSGNGFVTVSSGCGDFWRNERALKCSSCILLHFPGMVVDRQGNVQFGPDSLQSVTVSHFHPFVFSAKRVCYVLGFIYCPLGVLVLLSTVHITPFFFLICNINLLSIITCLRFFLLFLSALYRSTLSSSS